MADKSITYDILGKDRASDVLKGVGNSMDGVAKKSDNVGSAFKKMGEGLLAGAVVEKVKDFFAGSITSASDLNETMSKTRAVFGPAADDMIAFGASAATALGQSQSEALDAADNFGNLFMNLGITTDKSAEMSKQLVSTASDLASFFNADPSEMLQNLQSALAGEYDPLQRYGFAINAAAVEQYALNNGLAATKKEITPAIQAQASYALIMKNVGAAAGDFAKTSDGLANSQRIAAAQFENMKATLGQELLPVVNAGVKVMNEFLGILTEMPKPVQNTIVGLGALAIGVSAGAVAFSKVKSAIAEVGDTFGSFRSKASAVEGDMEKVATSSGKLKAGLSSAGSVLGGPWGIALAAGTLAIGYFTAKHLEAKQRVEGLTESLKADNGVLGENTRAKMANTLETDGVLKAAQGLKLSLADVTAASLGDAAARDRITQQLAQQKTAVEALGEAHVAGGRGVQAGANALSQWSGQADIVTGAIGQQSGALAEARDSVQRTNTALGQTAGAAKDAASGLGQGQTAAERAKVAMDALTASLNGTKNEFLSGRDAENQYWASLDSVKKAVEENGKGLDVHTEKGRANRASLDGLAKSTLSYLDNMVATTGAGPQFDGALAQSRAQLEQTAVKFGMTGAQAKAYADKILAIPEKANTAVTVSGTETAVGKINSVVRAIATVNDKTVTITVNQVGGFTTVGGVKTSFSAVGGRVPGSPSRIDTEPYMLAKGEYVVNADSTQEFLPLLEQINAGQRPSAASVTSGVSVTGTGGGGVTNIVYVTNAVVGNEEQLQRVITDALDRIDARGGGRG